MSKIFRGKQVALHDSEVIVLGLYESFISSNKIQYFIFKEIDKGPFYLNKSEKLEKKN